MSAAREKKEEVCMVLERMLGSEPCSLDDLSERLNACVPPAFHIAAGTIEMVLDELVSSGRAKVEGDGAKRVWRAAFDPNPERRAAVVESWMMSAFVDGHPLWPAGGEREHPWSAQEMQAEVRQLKAEGHVDDAGEMTPDALGAILSMGLPAWSRASLDLPVAEAADPTVQVQPEQLVQVASGDQEPALTAEVYRDLRRRLQRLRDDLAMRGDGSVGHGLAEEMAGDHRAVVAMRVARALEDAIDRIQDTSDRIQALRDTVDEVARQRDDAGFHAEQMQAFLRRLDDGGTIVPYSAISGPAYAIAMDAGRVFDTPDGRRLIYVPGP